MSKWAGRVAKIISRVTSHRVIVPIVIGIAGLFCIAVGIFAFYQEGGWSPVAGTILAAVLAVIAALVSAWTGQRLVELQEDALKPNIQLTFDARSRYQTIQLRLANRGQSPAHDVKVEWSSGPPSDGKGNLVQFGPGGVLPVLNAGEHASVVLDHSQAFFKRYDNATFSGRVTFTTSSGEVVPRPFLLSAEHERRALLHESEEPKTHYELQKLPERLESIGTELTKLREALNLSDRTDHLKKEL
jgi:hypothetical protein